MTKEIRLTQGFVALVDDEDYEWLNQWKWHFDKGYAVRHRYFTRKHYQRVPMHRLIAETPAGFETDHINGNKLDNRRSNLRTATHSQNMQNRQSYRGSSSQFKGVSWHKQLKKWVAYIDTNNRRINLGCFLDETEAAKARDAASLQLHLDYALLNFPNEVTP